MVWSPLSNLLLYGGTADIARARAEELPIALGSDWSPSGSKNLLAELKVAWLVSEAAGRRVHPRELVAMATVNPARMLKWDGALGSIEPGKRADMVVRRRPGAATPTSTCSRARESAITLVVIDGVPRYGQPRPDAAVHRRAHGRASRGRRGRARVLDLTDAARRPARRRPVAGRRRGPARRGPADLPELARVLENPITAGDRARRQRRHDARGVVPRARPRRARRHDSTGPALGNGARRCDGHGPLTGAGFAPLARRRAAVRGAAARSTSTR